MPAPDCIAALPAAPDRGGAVGAALVAAALALPMVTPAQAESAPERGLIALKYLDYLDSQPGSDRIRVRSPAASILAPISGDWAVGGTLVSDAISGASPAYHTEAVTPMHDQRRAGSVDLTRYFPTGTLTVGANISTESDYLSRGLSLQASRSTEDKNTTWTAGLGINHDVINPTNHVVDHDGKHVIDLLLGLTQVWTTQDIVQFNLGWSQGRGDYSDPYKLADNRPRQHNHGTALARWNHFVDATEGTLRLNYRYYGDDWQVRAHTLGLEYVQPLPQGWTVTPALRLYTQSAARFYTAADLDPFTPSPTGNHYSSGDQRLSGFGARTLGLKVAKQLGADWLVDVKVEQYEQRGAWRLFGGGSTALAAFYARTVQLGLSCAF